MLVKCEELVKKSRALVADLKDEVKLVSRDPESRDFLRPSPGAMLKNEAGKDEAYLYIGALPPATASSTDSRK
jgi:hypothetical protein